MTISLFWFMLSCWSELFLSLSEQTNNNGVLFAMMNRTPEKICVYCILAQQGREKLKQFLAKFWSFLSIWLTIFFYWCISISLSCFINNKRDVEGIKNRIARVNNFTSKKKEQKEFYVFIFIIKNQKRHAKKPPQLQYPLGFYHKRATKFLLLFFYT